MRFYYLLLIVLVGLLASISAARAQDSLAVARPVVAATPPPAAPGTAAALHRLFAAKRGARNRVLLGTLLGGGGVVAIGVASGSNGYAALVAIAAGVLILPAALVSELLYYNSYGRRSEREALAAARTHRLRAGLRAVLAPQYFPPTTP